MTSYLIDINVWLALTWDRHPHAGRAAEWFGSIPRIGTRLLFCRITQLGLLRLLTNQQVMGESLLSIAEALGVLDRWRQDPRVEFAAEPMGVEGAFRDALAAQAGKPATKAIMDAYLAAFAEAKQATVVTFDKALSGTAGLKNRPSVLLPGQ